MYNCPPLCAYQVASPKANAASKRENALSIIPSKPLPAPPVNLLYSSLRSSSFWNLCLNRHQRESRVDGQGDSSTTSSFMNDRTTTGNRHRTHTTVIMALKKHTFLSCRLHALSRKLLIDCTNPSTPIPAELMTYTINQGLVANSISHKEIGTLCSSQFRSMKVHVVAISRQRNVLP